MDKSPPSLHAHRQVNGNRAAIVFLHGFGGDYVTTWLKFPSLLGDDPRLKGWDVFTLGYATKALRLDVTGIYQADPDIRAVAQLLRTHAANLLGGYETLALIAHSMGGLAVQRALVDDANLVDRVSHVVLYGTPSRGLAKAWWVRFWKRSISDMAPRSPFITGLRKAWTEQFGKRPPFTFLAVAGDRDEFVPRTSSIDPFEPNQQAVVPGNHVEIVKPEDATDLTVQVAANCLAGDAPPDGPLRSDRVAIESREFQGAISRLLPIKDQLDEPALVQLALALESVGQQDDAIQLLESRRRRGDTDAMGVLAGRLKRRWIVEHRDKDARQALELYAAALTLAENEPREKPEGHAQAFYHAINVAFLELTYGKNRAGAQRMARRALDHCEQAPRDKWNAATEGEAWLHLGEQDIAIASYRDAVRKKPTPRELRSMYQQAVLVARHLGRDEAEKRLEAMFRSGAF
jgi:pimeloyl-ACP methyl ester carboxylesterase